jgi:hypothetical protein
LERLEFEPSSRSTAWAILTTSKSLEVVVAAERTPETADRVLYDRLNPL